MYIILPSREWTNTRPVTAMTIRSHRLTNSTRISAFVLAARHGSTATATSRAPRSISSVARPYAFHIGVAWAGKMADLHERRSCVPFSPDSPIGMWRDRILSEHTIPASQRPKKDPGEDFFYVQEVQVPLCRHIVVCH